MVKGKPAPLLSRCVQVTPSFPAAILLYRVCYWQRLATVEMKGHLWIAKSRDDWCEETGLSLDQYKRAASQLRRTALIATEKHFFNHQQVTFTRLLPRGNMILAGGSVSDFGEEGSVQDCTNQGCSIAPTNGADSHHSIHKGDTKGDTKGVTSGNSDEIAGEKIPLAEENPLAYDPGSKEANLASIADKLKNPGKKPVKKGDTKIPFHSVWSKAVSENTGDYQVPLTQKQKGQLGHFEKACPPGKAEIILATIIGDWHLFTQAVKDATGWYTFPAKPQIDFAVKNVQTAIQFWSAQEPDATIPEPQLQSTALASKPQKAEKQKMSAEELDAILNGEYDGN